MLVLSLIQLQNSRTVMQERDRVIRDLEEKVAFLEAEVRNKEVPHLSLTSLFHSTLLVNFIFLTKLSPFSWSWIFIFFLSAEQRNAWPYGVLHGRWGPSTFDILWKQARGCLQVSNLFPYNIIGYLIGYILLPSGSGSHVFVNFQRNCKT